MSELVRLEELETFTDAAGRARALAMQHQLEIGVRRSATGWEVLVPYVLSKGDDCGRADDDDRADSTYDDGDDESQQRVEEMEGDRDDFARSDEEGWYHSNEDQPNDPDDHDSEYGRFQAPRDSSGRTLPSGSGW